MPDTLDIVNMSTRYVGPPGSESYDTSIGIFLPQWNMNHTYTIHTDVNGKHHRDGVYDEQEREQADGN